MALMLTPHEEAQFVVFDDLETVVTLAQVEESGPLVECVDATWCPEDTWTP